MTTPETPERILAKKIARALFKPSSMSKKAQRLVLTIDKPIKQDMGGWCEIAAVRQIEELLIRELKLLRPVRA